MFLQVSVNTDDVARVDFYDSARTREEIMTLKVTFYCSTPHDE